MLDERYEDVEELVSFDTEDAPAQAVIAPQRFDILIRNLRWDPSGNQGNLFHGDPRGAANIMGWQNEEYDRLDDQQRREIDPAKRRELLIELANLAWSEVPVGVLHFIEGSIGYSPLLHNFEPIDIAGGIYWSIPFVWKEAASA